MRLFTLTSMSIVLAILCVTTHQSFAQRVIHSEPKTFKKSPAMLSASIGEYWGILKYNDRTVESFSFASHLQAYPNYPSMGWLFGYISSGYEWKTTRLYDQRNPDLPDLIFNRGWMYDVGIGVSTVWYTQRKVPHIFPAISLWHSVLAKDRYGADCDITIFTRSRRISLSPGVTIGRYGASPFLRVAYWPIR